MVKWVIIIDGHYIYGGNMTRQRPHRRTSRLGKRFKAGQGLTLNKWKYTSTPKHERNIPKRKYYVTMTDRFMSGWGKAKGLTNKFVVGTNFYEEAKRIRDNAEQRKEMKYVNITTTKPHFNPKYYLVSYTNAEQLGEIWRGSPGYHW